MSGGGGSVGSGAGGGCDMALTCADAVSDPKSDPATLCQDSGVLYDALAECTCTGACAADCGDNLCMGLDVSGACQNCVLDTVQGCGKEFNDCSNDL